VGHGHKSAVPASGKLWFACLRVAQASVAHLQRLPPLLVLVLLVWPAPNGPLCTAHALPLAMIGSIGHDSDPNAKHNGGAMLLL